MDIDFVSSKFEKECNNHQKLVRRYGNDMANRISRRLADLRAANNLEIMRMLPGRCHELTGNRKGQLSLDLKHPQRLLFEPANEPVPMKPDGGLDWERVTAVRIIEMEDTHE